jgi:predicted alternative tryptophan synthase beta-subunit
MHGPRLNTLQVNGAHGCRLSTLQGACANGVASMCRGRASALPAAVKPARAMRRQKTMRRIMTRVLEGKNQGMPIRDDENGQRHQARLRSQACVHGEFFVITGLVSACPGDPRLTFFLN